MESGKRRYGFEETDGPDLPLQSTYEDSSTKRYDMLAYRREADYRNTDSADLDSTIEIMSEQAEWIRNQLETESAMLYRSEEARYWDTGTRGPSGEEQHLIRQDGTGSQGQELIGNTYESSTYLQTVPDTALGVPDIYLNVLVPTNDGNSTASQSNLTEPGDIYGCKIKKVRRPMGEDDRVAIKKNRKNGVCLRCKMFKEKCRGGMPCIRCSELSTWKNLCVPALFKDKQVFNREMYNAGLGSLISNIQHWNVLDSSSEYLVEVSNGYKPVLRLQVHEFTPKNPMLLEHIIWGSGSGRVPFQRHPSTAIGLKKEIAPQKIDQYLDEHVEIVMDDMTQGDGPYTPVYTHTMLSAFKYASSDSALAPLVRKALRIWVAQSFFFHSPWRASGREKLGMAPINAPYNKSLNGITPLPRLLNQQLDCAIEGWVRRIEEDLLHDLEASIFKKRPLDWFGVYLAVYVLLSALEQDTWSLHTWSYDANKLKERSRQLDSYFPDHSNVSKSSMWPLHVSPRDLIEKNDHLAQMLVAHFRAITRGYVPFDLDWNIDQTTAMVGGDKEALEYMRNIGSKVKNLAPFLVSRRNAHYERENCNSLSGYFTSMLMLSDGEVT